jgi:hypothetical protein
MSARVPFRLAVLVFLLVTLAVPISVAVAHCDTLDGPVVKAARTALESGNINHVLIWVTPQNEAEVKAAFEKTLAVRKLGEQAKNLADMYFFETVVRLHRAGEGEPYTGLKPAGTDLGPIVPAADKVIDTNAVDALQGFVAKVVQDGIRQRFQHVMEKKNFRPDDVEAGRKFVRAYVEFVHYVEQIHHAAEGKVVSHPESQESPASVHSHSESR